MIGVSCTNFCTKMPEEVLDSLVGRFELWEIFSEAEHSIEYHLGMFEEILQTYDLSYTLHSPICDINIASLSDKMREASVREISSNAIAANKLGIEKMVVHPGLASMAVDGTAEVATERSKWAMTFLERVSKEYGVTIAIENMPSMKFFLGQTADDLARIVDGTDLSICLDIGHANTTGQLDEIIDKLGDRIAHVHIHDNHGETDEHLTLGEGNIDFEDVLAKLNGYDGDFIIESRSLESAIESQKVLDGLLYE